MTWCHIGLFFVLCSPLTKKFLHRIEYLFLNYYLIVIKIRGLLYYLDTLLVCITDCSVFLLTCRVKYLHELLWIPSERFYLSQNRLVHRFIFLIVKNSISSGSFHILLFLYGGHFKSNILDILVIGRER